MDLYQENWTSSLCVIILPLLLLRIYQFLVRNNNHWKKKGVAHENPIPVFGNMLDVILFRKSIGVALGDMYFRFKEPYFGIYVFDQPFLVLRSLDVIKQILIKDFSTFPNRSMYVDEKVDTISSKFLFFVPNPEWKHVRARTAPAFSTGKLKNMTSLIEEVAKRMSDYLEIVHGKSKSTDFKEVGAKFATDVIASCAFGVDANSFQNEDADFRRIGRLIFDFRWSTAISQVFHFFVPGLIKLIKMPFFDVQATSYFRKVLWEVVAEREKSNYKRNDLIDMIITMRKTDAFRGVLNFEGDRVVAQPTHLFFAGFETTSSAIGFTLYELSLNEDIQNRVRNEVQTVLLSHGSLTYEAIKELTFLQMVISETLRKYPILPFLDRKCVEDYTIPGSDVIIEKGTSVYVPLFGLHYDPEYFPNPQKFDPERFSEENIQNIPECCYMPFGGGPRNCVAGRFGILATKMCVASILRDFKVERNVDTPVPISITPKSFLTASTVGLPMTLIKIN